MGKHNFQETSHQTKESDYHRIIYCVWCGIVVWDFNKSVASLKELQAKAGSECPANQSSDECSREEIIEDQINAKLNQRLIDLSEPIWINR